MKSCFLMASFTAAMLLAGCGKSDPPASDTGAASVADAISSDSAMNAGTTIAANVAASPLHKTLAGALQAAHRSKGAFHPTPRSRAHYQLRTAVAPP